MSQNLEKIIKERIFHGEYPIGMALKSERYYANEFGISSSKVHRTLQKLVNEGYLGSKRGSGYFVNTELKCVPEQIKVAYIFPDNSGSNTNNLLRLKAPLENIWIESILCNGTPEDYDRAINEVLEFNYHDVMMIYPNTQMRWLEGLGRALANRFPVIFYDYQDIPNVFSMIGINHFEFGFMGAKILSDHGYEKVLYIGYEESQNQAAALRWRGFIEGCKQYKLLYEDKKVSGEDFSDPQNVTDQFEYWLKSRLNRTSALFASTGTFTHMAIKCFNQANIRVPDDIGFMATDFSKVENQKFTSSYLTTNTDHTVAQIIKLIKITAANRSLPEKQCICINPLFYKGESLYEIK